MTQAPAFAADTGQLEEIVVSATKRGDQAIQNTPISIQAISGATLAARGAKEFADFASTVPSLQYNDLGPGDKKYIIRGVTSTGASTVGVYYDETVITAANAQDGGGRNADIRLYDLERIEVLKGPQGTLYGASSMSGTIRYITNKPKLDVTEGNVGVDFSGTQGGGTNYGVNGTVNLPVVDGKLAVRATGWYNDDSGFIDAIRLPSGPKKNINNDRTAGGRVQAKFVPTDQLSFIAAATIQHTHSDGSSRYTPPGALSFSTTGYPAVAGGDLLNTDLTQSPWIETLHTYSLTGEYSFDKGTITATTNWYDRDIAFSFDSSPILFFFGVPIPGITLQPQYRSVFSNELRYASHFDGPLNFVIGGLYQREKNNFEVQVVKSNAFGEPNGPFSPLNADDALSNPNGNTFFGRTAYTDIKQEAVFGEATYDVTEKLAATVGLRYFHAKQSAVQETTHPFGGFSGSPPGPQNNASNDSKVTYKFNLSYKPIQDVLVYATAAQGFRVGGLNDADLPFASNIPRSYGPDSLWNYEVGAKTSFFDNRLHLNGGLYTIRWSDTQVRAVDSTGAFPFTTNAGKVRINGLEFDVQAELLPGLELDFGGSYQTAKLREDQPVIPNNPNLGHKGDTLPNVPHFQGNVGLTYRTPVTDEFNLVLAGDVSYRSKTDTQFNKASPFNVKLAEYAIANLKAGVESDLWTISAYIRNVSNKRAQVDAISSDQDPLARLTVRPRTYGMSITRQF